MFIQEGALITWMKQMGISIEYFTIVWTWNNRKNNSIDHWNNERENEYKKRRLITTPLLE